VNRWEQMHRRALRQAARVIVIGDDMRDRILAKGASPERVVIVRDGSSPTGPLPDRTHPAVQEVRSGFPFVVLHAGNLGFYGAWSTLLKAADILRNESTGLVFVGDGANRAAMQSTVNGSPNVRFLPFRSADQIPHVMTAGDLHIITVKRGLEGVVVPSKMYGILAAGKPIVAVAPAECDVVSLGSKTGFSISVDPGRPGEFAERVRELLADPERLERMGRAAAAIAPQYDQKRELQKMIEILEAAKGIESE